MTTDTRGKVREWPSKDSVREDRWRGYQADRKALEQKSSNGKGMADVHVEGLCCCPTSLRGILDMVCEYYKQLCYTYQAVVKCHLSTASTLLFFFLSFPILDSLLLALLSAGESHCNLPINGLSVIITITKKNNSRI